MGSLPYLRSNPRIIRKPPCVAARCCTWRGRPGSLSCRPILPTRSPHQERSWRGTVSLLPANKNHKAFLLLKKKTWAHFHPVSWKPEQQKTRNAEARPHGQRALILGTLVCSQPVCRQAIRTRGGQAPGSAGNFREQRHTERLASRTLCCWFSVAFALGILCKSAPFNLQRLFLQTHPEESHGSLWKGGGRRPIENSGNNCSNKE